MKALSRNLLAGALLAALPMGGALACTTTAWNGGAINGAIAGDPSADVARYSGECALQPVAAGGSYVVDNSPVNETDYRARFYVYTGSPTGSPVIFRATDADDAGGTALIDVTYNAGAGSFDFSANGATGSQGGIQANRWYGVEMYYDAGAAFSATVKGNAGAAQTVAISGTPGAQTVNSAALGAVTAAAGSDTLKFDEFESTRSTTTSIGWLCRGDSNGDGAIGVADAIGVANEFGGSLASGQPDCNEDGLVGVADAICIANAFTSTGAACP